jgi:FkbM family methyltransferase
VDEPKAPEVASPPSFTIPALLGLARSLLLYYAIPGRARAWRAFYAGLLKPGELAFDIGAHAGNRSAALLAAGARVVALEPQPLFASLLRRLYGSRPSFTLVQAASGAADGETELLISSRTPTVSTVSADWAAQVSADSSFATVDWDQRVRVPMRSLDTLIAQFRVPALCKIDVEGYELDVLLGLSQPIRTLSYEFVPAALERAWPCLERLEALGYREFNFIKGEYPRFASLSWLSAAQLRRQVSDLPNDGRAGEIYARFPGG